MKLYGYWRSGTSHRVRLALGYKGISAEAVPVNLLAGEHREPHFRRTNPSGAVPALELDDGKVLTQSGAIIEYLDEHYSAAPLLPQAPERRAVVRQLCQIIACDIHPLQNLRVQKYLRGELEHPQKDIDAWLQRFLGDGLAAYESVAAAASADGPFSAGGQFTMAECFLIPQVYAAERFDISLDPFPVIRRAITAAAELPFVTLAAPEAQADAPNG